VLWGAFALANVLAILVLSDWETIPFHFVWVSLTLLYGFRVWPPRATGVLLAAVMLSTGAALAFAIARADDGFDELAEVPLMAAMFLAMVWHARRRQAAVEDAEQMAETEHRLLERQREFVRDASHELRTPITVARGHAELVLASATDPQARSDATIVIDELARLSRLSERLLLLASAEGAEAITLGQVDVRDLVEGVGHRWSAAAPRTWRTRAEATGTILADADRLRDAVDALVENATHVTEPGGAITVTGRADRGHFVLEVADDGPGIEPDRLPTLFERFSRTDSPRNRLAGGTGLGLSIVRAVAEAHGGRVDVTSSPGAGATFRIVIPGLTPDGPTLSRKVG
jgi:two-component system OmpR family sensor kinase